MPTRKKKTPSKTALAKYRKLLESEREELLAQTEDLDAAAEVSQWNDASFDDDAADIGTAAYEREQAQSLANHARRLLTQIEDALRRIEKGTYGLCERCGEAIEPERLEAIPYATLCMEDKRRDEHGR